MKSGSYACPAPLVETSVDRLPVWPEHWRELPPGATRRRYEDDRGRHLAVVSSASAPPPRTLHPCGRYHPPKQHPKVFRRQPSRQICHALPNERRDHQRRRPIAITRRQQPRQSPPPKPSTATAIGLARVEDGTWLFLAVCPRTAALRSHVGPPLSADIERAGPVGRPALCSVVVGATGRPDASRPPPAVQPAQRSPS